MEVEFIANVEDGLSAKTYYVKDCVDTENASFIATEKYCENAYIRVQFNNDGTFELLNKKNGAVYKNQNRFEITPDCGNEYDFKADGETRILNSDSATVTLVEKDEIKAVYEICVSVDGMKLCSNVTVYADKKEILFTTKVANAMKNVRLRSTFESNPTAKHVYAEGQFDLVRRNIQPAESWVNPDNSQRMNTFFAVGKDEGAGLVVATKGLYEYEVYRDGKNTMGITLLRAVGEMGDWFYFPTPAGQMQGEYEFSYCLIPFDTDFATAVESGYNYTYPKLLAMQENRHEGEDSLNGIDLTVEGTLLLSAVKKAEKSGEVIVRLYNPLQETAKISAKQAFKQTNLAETEDGEAVTKVDVLSKKIITLKIN
jgi:alpha-mannosidase